MSDDTGDAAPETRSTDGVRLQKALANATRENMDRLRTMPPVRKLNASWH